MGMTYDTSEVMLMLMWMEVSMEVSMSRSKKGK